METLSVWKSILLGAVQGATEFLPISSSGHLVIFQQWLSLSREGAVLMAYDVALHFGTLAAVLAVFYRDLWGMGVAVARPAPENKTERRLLFYLVLGTLPAAVLGLVFKGFFAELFSDAIPAGFFLLITGVILWLTRFVQYYKTDFGQMKQHHAWLVGVAQAAAILPGISRSGTTIAMGLFLRLKPEAAVRFSFLLAVPAICGATFLEAGELAKMDISLLLPTLLGVLAAFGVGILAIRFMLRIVARHQLYKFAWYCWGLGGFVLVKELFL